ncbi:MAG: calcium-binding protein [Microvirga sp.]
MTPVGILSQDVPGLAVFLNPADADGKAFMTAGFPSNVNSGQSMFAQDGTFGQTNAGITSLNGITLAIGQSGSPLLFNYEDHVYTVGVVHSFDDPNGNGTGDIGEPIYGTILTANLYKNLSDRLNLVESNTDSAQLPQNIIFGGSAGDSFTGSHRREKIVLLGGNDMADGYKGDDEIYGDDGDDALFGGLGDDTLDGGAGADTLDGGSGDDTLIGGDGADVFVIGKGADRIVGADATDRLYIRVGSLHPFAEERQHGEPLPEDALGLPVRGGFLAGDAEWSIEAAQRFPSSFALYDGDVLYDVIQGHGETGFYARFAEEFWRTVTTTSATKLQVRGRVARTPLRQRVITGLVPVISIACRRASGRMAGSSPAMTRDEWRLPCPAASARRFLDCGRRSPS